MKRLKTGQKLALVFFEKKSNLLGSVHLTWMHIYRRRSWGFIRVSFKYLSNKWQLRELSFLQKNTAYRKSNQGDPCLNPFCVLACRHTLMDEMF